MKSLIIGLGSSGQRYARVIRDAYKSGQIDVYRGAHKMGLISRDLLRIDESIDPKEYYRLDELTSLSKLNKTYDLVVISTPPNSHLYYFEKVVHHSKRVIVEKPISINLAEAQKMMKINKEFGSQLLVGYQHYFNPIFNKVIEEAKSLRGFQSIEAAFLEPLQEMNPFRNMSNHHLSSRNGGGALLALSHEIDFLLTLKPNLIGHLSVREFCEDSDLRVLDTCFISSDELRNAEVNIDLLLSIASGTNKRAGKISDAQTEIIWDIQKREVCRRTPVESVCWQFHYHPDDLIKVLVTNFMQNRISENEIHRNLQRAIYIAELSKL